jgi:hypothetical protein
VGLRHWLRLQIKSAFIEIKKGGEISAL